MLIHLHKQATRTPKVRVTIQYIDDSWTILGERFGVTPQTSAQIAVSGIFGSNRTLAVQRVSVGLGPEAYLDRKGKRRKCCTMHIL
jgi:hypothetical protein